MHPITTVPRQYCALKRPDGSFSDYPSHGDASHCCDGLRTEAQQPESIEETRGKIQNKNKPTKIVPVLFSLCKKLFKLIMIKL
jgi:hypothetical protein